MGPTPSPTPSPTPTPAPTLSTSEIAACEKKCTAIISGSTSGGLEMLNDCKDMCSEAVGSRSGSFNSSTRCNVTGYLIHTEGGIAFCPEGCNAGSGSDSRTTAGTNSVCVPHTPCCFDPWFWPDGSKDDPKAWPMSSDQYKCLSRQKRVKNNNNNFAEFAKDADGKR